MMKLIYKSIFSFLFALYTMISSACLSQDRNIKLWYDKPASQLEETLPLGNGRLGMMPDGGVFNENIDTGNINLFISQTVHRVCHTSPDGSET
jgi:alpha-L-fucosidase 2